MNALPFTEKCINVYFLYWIKIEVSKDTYFFTQKKSSNLPKLGSKAVVRAFFCIWETQQFKMLCDKILMSGPPIMYSSYCITLLIQGALLLWKMVCVGINK